MYCSSKASRQQVPCADHQGLTGARHISIMTSSTFPVPPDGNSRATTNTSSPLSATSPVIVPHPQDATVITHTDAPAPHETPEAVESHEQEQPTDSHVLANADHDEKGVAQLDHGHLEVKDLGWDRREEKQYGSKVGMPPIVGGLENEELWTLIRRFNKVSVADGERIPISYLLEEKRELMPIIANVPCQSLGSE